MSEHLSEAFVAHQRRRLESLQTQMMAPDPNAETAIETVRDRNLGEVQDSGDEGAEEAQRGIEDALDANTGRRLGHIVRALEKIEEGSYGLSDVSGEPIAQARLEAVPEATLTIEEAEARERRATAAGAGPAL